MIDAYDHAGGTHQRERLTARLGLGRALAVTGRLAEARRRRAEAIADAESVGDPRLNEEVLAGFDVPAIWTRNDDDLLSGRIVAAAEDALTALGSTGSARRSRLLSTLALELRGTVTDRGRRAADEAETIARTIGDPGLLAFALNARFMHAFHRVGLAGERARIGAELVDLAARHQLVTFEVLGHLSWSRPAARWPTGPAPTRTPAPPTVSPNGTSCRWSASSPGGTRRCGWRWTASRPRRPTRTGRLPTDCPATACRACPVVCSHSHC
ncbi:hypothetical protein JNW91_31195, partial [Micromonospora sp. STR1_7]|nr:hypothetical protein [Micromonospora parastrephiae]